MKTIRFINLCLFSLAIFTGFAIAEKKEIEAKRTATSKVFRNDDGTHTFQIYTEPKHYYEGGKWKEIDTKIVPYGKDGYDYACLTSDIKTYFKGNEGLFGVTDKKYKWNLIEITDNDKHNFRYIKADLKQNKDNSIIYKYGQNGALTWITTAKGLSWIYKGSNLKKIIYRLSIPREYSLYQGKERINSRIKIKNNLTACDSLSAFMAGISIPFAFRENNEKMGLVLENTVEMINAGEYEFISEITDSKTDDSISVKSQSWLFTAGNDAFIASGYPDSYNNTYNLWVGYDSTYGFKKERSLLRFDVSPLAGGASVTSATFSARVKGYTGPANTTCNVTAYRATSSWTEGGATWNNMSSYYSESYGTQSVGDTGRYNWDVKNLSQYWISGTYNNYGLMLIAANESGGDKERYFYSDESGTYVPSLNITCNLPDLITYTPSGWDDKIVASSVTGTNTTNTLYAQKPTYIDLAIMNNTSVSVIKGFYVKIYLDGSEINTQYCSSLSGNTSKTWSDINYTVYTPGWHKIKIVIDTTGDITEESETNNSYEKLFYWKRLPDLWPGVITTSSPLITNEPCTIYWSVWNTGDTISGGFYTGLYVDGNKKDNQYLSSLAAGGYQPFTTTYTATTGGNHTIKVICDSSNQVMEIDDSPSDNILTYTASWNTRPNACTNPSPVNGVTGVDLSVILQWYCTDPDGQAITKYRLQLSTDSTFTSTVFDGEVTANSYQATNLWRATKYYWRVKGYDGSLWCNTWNTWRFTTADNQFWVSGHVKYKNLDDNTIKGIPQAWVVLYDTNDATPRYIDSVKTLSDGSFNFGFVTAASFDPKFIIHTKLINEICVVKDTVPSIYTDISDTSSCQIYPSGITTIYRGINETGKDSIFNQACHIFDAINQTYNWVDNNTSPNWKRSQITVSYNYTNTDSTSRFRPVPVGIGSIIITGKPQVLLRSGLIVPGYRSERPYHEYAHAIMYKVYGDTFPPGYGVSEHYPYKVTNPGNATTEGFAEFLPCAVKNNKDYLVYYKSSYNTTMQDVETNQWHYTGDAVSIEGAVASIWWDMQDTFTDSDEDSGGLSNKFSNIFSILKDNKIRNISQFYSYYRSNPALAGDTSKLKRIYYKHGIDYYKAVLGFEVWQSPPINNPVPNQSGCVNINSDTTGIENGVYPHNGDYMYRLSGTDASSDNSYAFVNLFDVNIPLIPGPNYAAKYLSFWVYIVESPGAGCISLELVTAKKGAIRDYNYKGMYISDQFGQRLHPAGRNVPKGQWVNYICDLSILNPSIYADDTLRQIQVAYDDGNSAETGDYLAYIDDIEISEFSYPTFAWGYVEDPTTVKVSWNDNNIDEDGFHVWWKNQSDSTFINPPLWVDSVSGMGGKGYCTITGLSTGSSYNFMVRSKRGEQVSAYEWRYATSKIAAPETPAPPSAKFHTPSLEINDTIPSINVNNAHYDYSSNIFEWERKIDSTGVWTKIKETPSWYVVGHTDATNIIDSNIIFNHDYYYRLRAYNGCGKSEYSVETKIPIYFKPPTNTNAIAYEAVDPLSGTHTLKIDLSWGDNSTIEAGTLVFIKKAGGDSFVVALGPNITSASISGYWDGQWHSIEPLSTYYIKVAQYWMYYNGYRRTEYSNTVEVFVPKIGYTNNNNARKLFRGGDDKLNATFYDGTQIYWASSINNGLSWSVTAPKTGGNPTVAEKKSNSAIYSVRVKKDSLLLDSLGVTSGFGKVIKTGAKMFNPAIATDSLGNLYCAWAETVLAIETRYDPFGRFIEHRWTYTMKVQYAKRTGGVWSSPSVLQPISVSTTGWQDFPPSPFDEFIDISSPSIAVNKSGNSILPHITWEHKHGSYNMFSGWSLDTSIIYHYNAGTSIGMTVSATGVLASSPCLGVNNDGALVLAWQQNGDIYRSTNNGSAWSTPYNVSNNTGASQMPTVACDKGGTLHFLWYDDSDSGFVQKISTLPVGTDAKLAIAKLTELPQGEESIVWEDVQKVEIDSLNQALTKAAAAEDLTGTINENQIFYRRYKNNAWSPIYRLTASEDISVYPALPLTDDPAQMGFLWTEGNYVKYKRLPDLDGPTVAVTYPNGGEVLYSGRRYNITWSSTDNRGIKSYVLYYTTNYIAQDDPTSTDAVTLWRSVATIVGGLNYYSWRVPYNVASTNCRFKVVAYDSSGNTATDISDKNFTIKSRDIIVVETDKAIAYNNAGKIARSSDGLLHVCYNSIDSVHYLSSSNDGQTWATPLNLGKGSLPTIVTDSKNMPALAWIKQWDHDTGGGVFFSRQTATGWSVPETLAYMQGVPWDYIGGYSPPAMTIKNDTISLVFEYSYGGGIPPHIAKGWALHHTRFAINNISGKKDTILDAYTETIDPPIWQAPASASIATDYKGYDHISWHRKDKVYYRMRKPDGNYGNILQLSGSGIAQNPCISISGVASAVWVEDGDIYQRTGFDQKWETAVNISASGASSMMPYICGSDVLWTEDVLSDYEVYLSSYSTAKMTYDVSENLSCTDYASIFPHETKLQTNEGTKTYRIWAEEIEPELLWGLTFMADTTELEPTYALDAGLAEPSIFTVQRDGYITYGTAAKAKNTVTEPFKTVDYDTTALIYSFDNFDPDKKYKITLSFYQETGQEIKLKPIVNKLPLGEIKVTSGEEAILDKPLPEASYKDGQITLTIEKTKGPIAVCGKILIYENPTGQGHGGTQSEEITSITPNYINKLYQNCPNPFSHKTSFMYQIKNQGQVTFKVYNALGQLVRTLVNEIKPAGTYQVEWDGKDGCGRQVSSGVYLYNISTGAFESTKKLIVLK
ncbi:DNRLRE domain-containing protein [candidate division TA06 bacterium]|nr:DNRLRE domain-containing protein [candidate division TA06 bacterium]